MSNYTPGPWIMNRGTLGIASVDGIHICDVRGYGQNDSTNEANRRLIASTPELLEALFDALPYVEDVLSNPEQLACFKRGVVEKHVNAIRAAIRKAKGEA